MSVTIKHEPPHFGSLTTAGSIGGWRMIAADEKRIAELEHQVATRDESIHNLTALLDKVHRERRELNAWAERTCHAKPHLNLTVGDDFLTQSGLSCSECGGRLDLPVKAYYCPNCGAKVIEEKGKGNDGEQ